ncbi:MAG: ABC transporter permease [Anaerolineae bacterium]
MAETTSEATARDIDAQEVSDVGELSQTTLIWMRFKRNKLAVIGGIGLIIMYFLVAIGPFLASNNYRLQNQHYLYGPPTPITFVGPDGRLGLRPYTYEFTTRLDPESFKFVFDINRDQKLPIRFFVRGDPYTMLGFIKSDIHLIGVAGEQRFYPLGADALGRDVFARLMSGGQISMTVGLLGVFLTIILGSVMGTISGYFGGLADDVIQRVIELILSFPTVPLWAALAAALPPISQNFTVVHRYFLITVVLSLVNWTGLARQLRAKVMSYREADFVMAALAAGAKDGRIIFTHMMPNAASHIIVVGALSIPGMILAETSLSFLGLGILPPAVSWGSLLSDAQNVSVVIEHPWLMTPGIAVVLSVLFYSFLGDALRDAADPYSI